VVTTLDAFSQEQNIDLLVIRPHRHGVWANVFGKNNTRAIAHLNTIPILALRGGGI
jgi:nucleotide-binding universal stress UspA family protein